MSLTSVATISVALVLLLNHFGSREFQIAETIAVYGLVGLLVAIQARLTRDAAQTDRWRLSIEAANLHVWEWDLRRNWLTWGSHSTTLSNALLDLIHPEDQAALAEAMRQARRSQPGTMVRQEFRVQRSEGQWFAATGQVTGDRVVGVAIDITPHKQAELNLQRLNANLEAQIQIRTAQLEQAIDLETRLKRITDKVRDSLDESQILQTAVQELGVGLGVRSCNAALYDLDSRTSTVSYEYNSTMFPLKGHVAQMADFAAVYDRLLQGEYVQFCNIEPNPVRGRVVMLACPIADDRGILGDLWLINDKDYLFREVELRLVQQVANQCAIAIRQARLYESAQDEVRSLERLNWLKDEFLSTVSHELRTPVANMKLSICLLESELVQVKSPKINQYLQILNSECDREIHLINDLLDLQRLEAGRRSLLLEPIDLMSFLPQLVASFQTRARDRQQQLRLLPIDLPTIVTDLSSLDRILSELLNNACKYTPPAGEIVLNAQSEGDRITLTVCNAGIEIPPAELPRLFDKFYRVPKGDPWKQGGTGLGLALVQRLVELLEGSISVTSANQQTCFTINLPDLEARSLPPDSAIYS